MSILSDKYLAGFLDADGCIGVQWKGGKYKPLLNLSWSQKAEQDKVIAMIHEEFGGSLKTKTVKGRDYKEVTIRGKAAEKLLGRIKKHLVLKRYYAEVCLEVVRRQIPTDPNTGSQYLKKQRKVKSLPLPNFPPRKWLAGYFDGDGCLYSGLTKTMVAAISFGITSANYDTEGIEIIQKAFGGTIRDEITKQSLVCSLPPSKAKKFLGYFSKHLILKKDQAEFVLRCAAMGHYRDGKNIHAALKHLKSHPHRLSSPEHDIVSELISGVRDKQWGRHGHFDSPSACVMCGKNDKPHYAKGMCRECHTDYHKGKCPAMRQSALC